MSGVDVNVLFKLFALTSFRCTMIVHKEGGPPEEMVLWKKRK